MTWPVIKDHKSDDNSSTPVFSSHSLPILHNPKMDGNCQFAAVAHQLHVVSRLSVTADMCRQQATEWITSNRDIAIKSVSCTCTPSGDECESCWQKYIMDMKKTGTFGDHLTLIALSAVYGIQWIVFSTDVRRHCLISTSPLDEYDSRVPIGLIGHDLTSQHYLSLGQVKHMQAVYASVRGMTQTNTPSSPCTSPNSPPIKAFGVNGSDEPLNAPSKQCNDPAPQSTDSPPPDIAMSVFDGPVQPKLNKYPLSQFGTQKRAFSSTSYDRYPFIEYSVCADKIFCFACRFFPPSSGNAEEVFVKSGFHDWKKLSARLQKHAECPCHKESIAFWLGWQKTNKTGNVFQKMHEHLDDQIKNNRKAVESLLRVVILCGKQDLALRGHNEDQKVAVANHGNFREILDLLRSENANTDAVFRNLPKNANYQSQESQNELLKVVADTISETIINDIKASGMFSVIADEARDISCSEQMSICIRFVKEAAIYERFISFVNVHELSAVSLAAEIVKNLQELNLTLSQCVAQCYDGAASGGASYGAKGLKPPQILLKPPQICV